MSGVANGRRPSMWAAGRALVELGDDTPSDDSEAPVADDAPRGPTVNPVQTAGERGSVSQTQTPSSGRSPARDSGPWLVVLALKTVPESEPEPGAAIAKPMFHRVAAVAFLRAKIHQSATGERLEVVECRAGGRPESSERELLAGFWRAFEEWKPKLVTWNGRGFGLPVLKFRSMRQQLTARYLHEAGDKWSGYGNRYAQSHHVDLMDSLSDFHASPFPSLNDVAKCFGISTPPKHDVAELMAAGDIAAVREQAKSEAQVVFDAYARWRAFTGAMTWDSYAEATKAARLLG